jgi:hypothetical protein
LIAAYSLQNLPSVIQKEFCNTYRHLADVSLLPNVSFAANSGHWRTPDR